MPLPTEPYRRGEFVVLGLDDDHTKGAMVGFASSNGVSLIMFFDGVFDGHVGAMPLLYDEALGYYRTLFSEREVIIIRRPPTTH